MLVGKDIQLTRNAAVRGSLGPDDSKVVQA